MTDILKLNKAYFTKIECSNYNPNSDGEVTVTVSLIDFNGSPIPNTAATITVDRGYFTNYKRNNSNILISGTSTKSYEGTTGDDGTFVMTYKCSEWGLATFSANNTSIQIKTFVTTFYPTFNSKISSSANTLFYREEDIVHFQMELNGSANSGLVANYITTISSTLLPNAFLPIDDLDFYAWNIGTNSIQGKLGIRTTGDIKLEINQSNTAFKFFFEGYYKVE